mmetsp:Transcript_40688/g.85480  ORF Transcript_40688/g.85480 Transcript_40688/m.85480 type:complete len:166 (-) Transcript_40688:430-927(-)
MDHHNPIWRVGIDFGETIGKIEEEEPLPLAFEMVRHLVGKFDAENVFIVSKAGPDMERKTLAWLERTGFHSQTRFLKENVIFVREYHEKADVVRSLGINIFLDDSVKVVRSLSAISTVDRIFWMHAKPSDIGLILKGNRHKIAIVQGWSRTTKYFQKIPRAQKNG